MYKKEMKITYDNIASKCLMIDELPQGHIIARYISTHNNPDYLETLVILNYQDFDKIDEYFCTLLNKIKFENTFEIFNDAFSGMNKMELITENIIINKSNKSVIDSFGDLYNVYESDYVPDDVAYMLPPSQFLGAIPVGKEAFGIGIVNPQFVLKVMLS